MQQMNLRKLYELTDPQREFIIDILQYELDESYKNESTIDEEARGALKITVRALGG